MLDHLYIFTLQFPYGHGESFLEAELPYLLKKFPKVTIVPRDPGGELRKLPDGVAVDDSFSRLIPSGFGMWMAIFISLFCNAGIYREVFTKPHLLTRWKSIKLLLYYAVIKRVIKKWYAQRETEHSIFYTYWIESFTYGLCELRDQKDFCVVTRAHRYDLFEATHSRPFLPFRDEIYSRIDQVHVVSKAGKAYLQTKLKDQQLKLSRLGTEDPGFLSKPSEERRFCIVSCSNIIKLKRIDLIIQSIKLFATDKKNQIEWIHIGDGELRNEMEHLAKIHLGNKVKYGFLGSIHNKEVFDIYQKRSVDVLINLSTIEGIPVSFMEAMSCGIPVIGTDVGGVSEILNGSNGILLNANPTIEEVGQALTDITDSKNQHTYRLAARKTWEDNFNASDNYTDFVKSIESFSDSID